MYYTRYQSATPLIIGPVIRATNGYSPLTGLTSASMGFYYWVGTGPTTGNYATAGSSAITEVASGYYKTFISSDMTNALGPGVICYETSGSSGLPMVDHYVVLSQHTFDALIKGTGTDLLQVEIQAVAGATVNSTFPWHQTSAQGFIIDTGQLAGLSTLATANFNSMSTFTTANLVGISTLATANFNTMSTFTTANLVGISTLSTANLNDLSTFDVAEVVTIATSQLAGLSTLTTANFNTMSVLTTANLNNVSTFGVSNVYDVLTHEELMKVIQSHLLGISSFDGTDLKLYDHGGSSFIGFTISTAERSVTT